MKEYVCALEENQKDAEIKMIPSLPKRSIVWYCGKSWEPWSPKSLKKGIAGSQNAVIYPSREWARIGCEVYVYSYCKGQEGVYSNVHYLNFDKIDKKKSFDILIIWRDKNIHFLDEPKLANKVFLDLHDIPYRKRKFTRERVGKISKIITRSRFHYKQFINQPWAPYITKKKLAIISNGIDKKCFKCEKNKEPYRLIYTSSYSRGLEYMLKYGWPIIKKEIPEAEFNIYYGWDHFEHYKKDLKSQEWKKMMIDLMNKPGVTNHGRIGYDKLMEERSKSAIHYYASTWFETDCISVRESALLGCVPVTTKYAALAEKPYCVRVSGNPWNKKIQQKVAYKIVELLKNQKKLEKIRRAIKKFAEKDEWNKIAELWLKMFLNK